MAALEQQLELLRPPVVRFGAGQVESLAAWVAEQQLRRPLVISDAFNAQRVSLLGLDEAAVYGDVTAEPDRTMLEAALEMARWSAPDIVIGFGGGSAMDLAKLVAVMLWSEKQFDEISGRDRAPSRTVRLAQVPTTAGTGSEVGTRSLITDPVTLSKVATESREMLADIAIIDPALALTVPSAVTAATGIDALAHCAEAYTSRRSHPVIDAYAIEGVRLVGRYLRRAIDNGADLEARAGLALAAFYGGICLGPVNTTAGHAIAYPLGTRYSIPHGVANAVIFPHVLAINAPAVVEKTADICRALGLPYDQEGNILTGAYAFCKDLGLDMKLSAYGVERGALHAMAKEAHGIRRLLDYNPRDLSETDILRVYEAAF